MNKLSHDSMQKIKQDMKNRYLAGDTIHDIASDPAYGVVDRNVYYHIGPLTAEEKGIHAKNLSLKQTIKRKESHEQSHNREESNRGEASSDLADFK
jgi:uncharacterized protein YfaT (DUF1175 family)